MKKFDEIQFLEELKKRIAKIDENLHCEVEIISGHPSSAVLCVFPSREKSFSDTIGFCNLRSHGTNPPCWRASSLLFPHWYIKTKRPEPVKLDLPLF